MNTLFYILALTCLLACEWLTDDINTTKGKYDTSFETLWEYSLSKVSHGAPHIGLSVYNNTLYTLQYDRRLAFNAASGSVIWEYEESFFGYEDRIHEYGENLLYDNSKTAYSVKKETGEVVWSTELPNGIYEFSILHNSLWYIGTNYGRIYVLDANSGEIVRQADLRGYLTEEELGRNMSGGAISINSEANLLFFSAGIIQDFRSTGRSGYFFICDLDSLNVLDMLYERAPTPHDSFDFSATAYSYGDIVVANGGGDLIGYNFKEKKELWRIKNGYANYDGLIGEDNYVLFTDNWGFFQWIDIRTGKVLWRHLGGESIFGRAAISNGIVYVSAGGLYAVEIATGTLLWDGIQAKDGSKFHGHVEVAEGKVFASSIYNLNCIKEITEL